MKVACSDVNFVLLVIMEKNYDACHIFVIFRIILCLNYEFKNRLITVKRKHI